MNNRQLYLKYREAMDLYLSAKANCNDKQIKESFGNLKKATDEMIKKLDNA